jgi:endogenous inhibitor of DNA gyrase (YacG/DUF329 family)
MKRSDSGIGCKLCGMRSSTPVYSDDVPFCCSKCATDFQGIMKKTSDDERGVLMDREIII